MPALAISPYARAGYVSHERRDTGAILRDVETNFGLMPLGENDTDNDDPSDCSDYAGPARTFRPTATDAGFAATLRRLGPDATPVDD